MFLDKKEETGKKNRKRAVIGYDLSNSYVQISYCLKGSGEPETFAIVTGTEQYNIPAILCKRNEVNQWFYGKEALKNAEEGILVDNLAELARIGEPVAVGEDSFDPVALLTLFIKRSLSAVARVLASDYVEGIMFTVDNLDKRMVEVLAAVTANLQLRTGNTYFQSHVESFYFYTLFQPAELWQHEVLLCDFDGKILSVYELNSNRRTTPKVVFIDTEKYSDMNGSIADDMTNAEKHRIDNAFLSILKENCGGKAISSVYLIGDGFKEGWFSESLRFLCQGRRVFRGNNLYSKGACYGMREKIGESAASKEYVFLGLDRLKANIGMKVVRKGIDSYFAIMDAGINWFDSKKEFDVILESDNFISIILTPLNGKDAKEINMILEGLPERPPNTTRLRIIVEMTSENSISVKVRDIGFGELFPSSGGEWIKLFEI